MITGNAAKRKIISLGVSQRKLAPLLGVTHPHLSYVLNGHRESRRLLEAIARLTQEDIPEELKGGRGKGEAKAISTTENAPAVTGAQIGAKAPQQE